MKTLVTILSVVAISCGAYAQGKVAFSNGSTHLISYSTDTGKLMTGDVGKAGTAVLTDGTFKAELWYNTSGGSGVPTAEGNLVRYLSTWSLSSGTAGFLPGTSLTLNGSGNAPVAIASGVYGSFQERVWSGSSTSWADAVAASLLGQAYIGKSPVFTCTAGSVAPNQLYQTTPTANSSWLTADGPIYMTSTVPEPATFALAGLGAAAMMIFRRRK